MAKFSHRQQSATRRKREGKRWAGSVAQARFDAFMARLGPMPWIDPVFKPMPFRIHYDYGYHFYAPRIPTIPTS